MKQPHPRFYKHPHAVEEGMGKLLGQERKHVTVPGTDTRLPSRNMM